MLFMLKMLKACHLLQALCRAQASGFASPTKSESRFGQPVKISNFCLWPLWFRYGKALQIWSLLLLMWLHWVLMIRIRVLTLNVLNAKRLQIIAIFAATVRAPGNPFRIAYLIWLWIRTAREISQLLSVTAVDPMSGRVSDVALTIMSVLALSFGWLALRVFNFKAVNAKSMHLKPIMPATVQGPGKWVRIVRIIWEQIRVAYPISQLLSVTAVDPMSGRASKKVKTVLEGDA